MDLERQRQKENKANEKRLLDIAMRVPKAAPITDKRNKGSSHGWYSLEPKGTRKIGKTCLGPASPKKLQRSASTPELSLEKDSFFAQSNGNPDLEKDGFGIQLEQMHPIASHEAGADNVGTNYQPCYSYRPSVLPAPDPDAVSRNTPRSPRSQQQASSHSSPKPDRERKVVIADAATRALYPEGSPRKKKTPRDDVSQTRSKGTISASSIISHYVQTRSNASRDLPISNLDSLDRYSAVPVVHLAKASALSQPSLGTAPRPAALTAPEKSQSVFRTPEPQGSPSKETRSTPKTSPRATFFSQVASDPLGLSSPVSSTAPSFSLPAPGPTSALGLYRFGKDFSDPPSHVTTGAKGSTVATGHDVFAAPAAQTTSQRRRSSGFHDEDEAGERKGSGTTSTTIEIPSGLASRFSIESSADEA